MLQRLSCEVLAIDKDHISVLEIYCSYFAKRKLESRPVNFLDEDTQIFNDYTKIVIEHSRQVNPVLLPEEPYAFKLLERNEFYGIDGLYLPCQVLASAFTTVYMDTLIELPEHRFKHELLNPRMYKDQTDSDFELELDPKIVLDLTKRLRDYLPKELLKGVTSYLTTPASC